MCLGLAWTLKWLLNTSILNPLMLGWPGGVNGLRILTLDGSCQKCYRNIQIIFEYPNTKLINYNLVIPYLANVRMATITSTEALTWIGLTYIFYHWDIVTKCNLFFYLQYTNICRCKQTQKTNILGISICSAKKTKYKAFQDRRSDVPNKQKSEYSSEPSSDRKHFTVPWIELILVAFCVTL